MLNDNFASNDEATIRALEDKFATAFNAGDVDEMMKNYIPDETLIVFDIAISDLSITVDGNLGFSHSIQHVTGTDLNGHPVDRTVRVTDGYRKIGGIWLIVLEHVSVPVDIATGRPDFNSKP
jgi:ketosteroid isomerase-like protein